MAWLSNLEGLIDEAYQLTAILAASARTASSR
jgi:hypothetical protein